MAQNQNSITITGNITRDPEMRFTAGGKSTTSFGVAVNRSWRNQQTNDWEERTSFFNVVTWGTLAENVSASLKKGARVVVTGRLEQRSWETEQGEKRTVVEVVADDVGPSLLFATADVHRVERTGPAADGGQRSAAAPAQAQAQAQGPTTVPDYDQYGEEPF